MVSAPSSKNAAGPVREHGSASTRRRPFRAQFRCVRYDDLHPLLPAPRSAHHLARQKLATWAE